MHILIYTSAFIMSPSCFLSSYFRALPSYIQTLLILRTSLIRVCFCSCYQDFSASSSHPYLLSCEVQFPSRCLYASMPFLSASGVVFLLLIRSCLPVCTLGAPCLHSSTAEAVIEDNIFFILLLCCFLSLLSI